MGLTKEQIVEIQEAARLNYAKHQREKEDKKELQRAVDERMGRTSKATGEGVTRPTGLELENDVSDETDTKPLSKMKKAELLEIVSAEEVDVEDNATNADLVKAIEDKRNS